MPTKQLPQAADITHLRHQAKDLLAAVRNREESAVQRVKEFHPEYRGVRDDALAIQHFRLSDAQLCVAREYGYSSWPRLAEVVATTGGTDPRLIHNERIADLAFARALDALDEGDAAGLRAQLEERPELVRQRVRFEGDNYFTAPTLLEFVAENPVRRGRLPGNIVEIARIILKAGAQADRGAVEAALGLVASGRVAREAGAQVPLIELLCEHGAAPDAALHPAVAHGEFAAARALLARGATLDLASAAAMGRGEDVARLMPEAGEEERQLGLALAAAHGRAGIVRHLLSGGADPNRYNPEGAHAHSTPLHQAALSGHAATVAALVEGGARRDMVDLHHRATARDWAVHAGHDGIAAYLAG